MALIFQRLARNFIKNGYYPTDSVTMERIIQALAFPHSSRIIDPCCGEGTALAEIQHAFSRDDQLVESYGVEYDEERAWHAKNLLNYCIHADIRDCLISDRQFGLLFLNPPYGDAVSDKAMISDPKAGRLRLEKEFYRVAHPMLQFEGVMVLIIPYYVLDNELSSWISRHFHDVQVFMAPEQQFKQCVIFGVKHKVGAHDSVDTRQTLDLLTGVGAGDIEAPELPVDWTAKHYQVPAMVDPGRFESVRLDAKQLENHLGRKAGLWSQYEQLFGASHRLNHRRPLCDVTDWHLALLLAAGQVQGHVNSRDGRSFVVRGDTFKDKRISNEEQAGPKGQKETIRIHTDVFVPSIKALDMTPGSETFGEVITIK